MKNKLIVKLFHCFIARTKKNNLAIKQFSNRPGFTLIELLIVIAVLGILAVGVLIALNVTGNLDKANLAKAKTFAASVENDLSIAQVGKWSFEDSANPGKDTSGHGNDGTVNGGAIWNDASTCGLGFGGCLSFDGQSNSYLQATSQFGDIDFGSSPFTLAAWINLDQSATALSWNPIIAIKPSQNTYYGIEFIEVVGQREVIVFLSPDPGPRAGFKTNSGGVKKGLWNHIVLTYDGSYNSSFPSPGSNAPNIKLFINGKIVNVTREDSSTGWTSLPTNSLRIGSLDTDFYLGLIDEVAIYNQSLTAYQIRELYAQGWLRHQLARH